MGLPRYHPDDPRAPKAVVEVEQPTVRIVTREDPTIGNERTLRGIPVAGVGGGAISGTRPGDAVARLEVGVQGRVLRCRDDFKRQERA